MRDHTHRNSPNIKPRHLVGLGLCTLPELEQPSAMRGRRPGELDELNEEEEERPES